MTMPEPKSASPLWLVVALVVAVIATCSDDGVPGVEPGPLGRGVYVQAAWQQARTMPGHQIHVVGEKIPCVKCHELRDRVIGGVSPQRCGECHEKEAKFEHAKAQASERFGPDVKADCTMCHGFSLEGSGHVAVDAGAGDAFLASDCVRCHSTRQGEIPAMTVHGSGECVTCHTPHDTPGPEPGACADCHLAVSTTHAAHGKSATAVCTTCHQHQHAKASEARGACATCHAKEKPRVPATALFAEGHQECIGCHRPHESQEGKSVACRSCHDDVHVLSASRVREHARCENCHAPHDVKGSTAQACARCHATVHSDHPLRGATGNCVGCHDPHPARAQHRDTAQKCSSCHQIAGSEHEFHGGTACKQCHTPHHFVLGASDHGACKACHGQQLSQVASVTGHQSCQGCHRGLPHRPATLSAGCETCHGATQHEATAGHKSCTNCHEPHAGSVGRDCKSCHTKEHQTAPRGHTNCTSCHKPHSGSTAKTECSGCHSAQAASDHGQLTQGCTSCHRPHGPGGVATPPSCTSCHKPATLAGLHALEKHRDCRRCHTAHGEAPAAAKVACLTCHTDRKNHFPEAPRCASCHLFGKTH